MYWPKVLPGLLARRSAQKPETKDTGGVRLPPRSQSGPQGSPAAAAFARQPGRRQPRQDSVSLPDLSSAAHRAGQVRRQMPSKHKLATCCRPVTAACWSGESRQLSGSPAGCLECLPCGSMMRLCRSRKCICPLSHPSTNRTDWRRSCSGSR